MKEGTPRLTPEEYKRAEGISSVFEEEVRHGGKPTVDEELDVLDLKAFDVLPYESLPRASDVQSKVESRIEVKGESDYIRAHLIDALEKRSDLHQESINIKKIILSQWDERGELFFHHPLYQEAGDLVDGLIIFEQEYSAAKEKNDFSRMLDVTNAINGQFRVINRLYKTIVSDIEKGNAQNP